MNPKNMYFTYFVDFSTNVVYIIVEYKLISAFLSSFIATIFASLFSEILARTLKAPTVIFLTTIAISIVPGSGLYYSMKHLLWWNWEDFFNTLKNTFAIAIGIVCRVILISAIFKSMSVLQCRRKNE